MLVQKVKEMPQIKQILIKMQNVKGQLLKQTIEKFDLAFENKDQKTMNECILVFFNLEILRDKI